ncbi:MAG: LEPR-XLL domain-containing protein, partial [Planctomycetes bacterium]|nr:LEPR-XLL domain-containing protein [Planctomycetota bacterium]
MDIWSALRRGLGAPAERDRQEIPTFELLEARVLLSADPLGLAANDPYGDDGLAVPAIVIEFDSAELASDRELAGDHLEETGLDEPTAGGQNSAASDEEATSDNPRGRSLSQIEHAATLPDTHLTDEHTLTETAVPSGAGVDTSSQLDPFTPDVRAAGSSEARGPPDGSDSGSTHSIFSSYSTSDDEFSSSSMEGVSLQSVPTLPGLRLVDHQPGIAVVTVTPDISAFVEIFNADFSDAANNPDLDGFTIDNTGAPVAGLWHLSIGRVTETGHTSDDSMYFGT